MPATLPYGSWPSPLTAEWAASSSPRLDGGALISDQVWWGTSVPAEGGRMTVRARTGGGTVTDLLPAPWNVRSRVHEYGGGAWTASPDGRLFFVEKTDQRIWTCRPGEEPRALTPEAPGIRYGGLTWQEGLLLAIRESDDGRAIVAVGTGPDAAVMTLVAGSDFVAQPALSPGGGLLAWVAWNHPDMPWDRTELRVGRIADGVVAEWAAVTSGDTAALQPTWTGPEELVYADDPTGRWNLWRSRTDAASPREAVAPADADTGGPLWVLGARWFAPCADGTIVAIRTHGDDTLVRIGPDGEEVPLPVPARSRLNVEAADGRRVLVSGSAPGNAGMWLVGPGDAVTQIAGGSAAPAVAALLPEGRPVTFDGPRGPVHAFDYPPHHPGLTGPDGARPPYVVLVHGGPTAHVSGVPDSKTAFFTSRGIGVLDVNYGGSTGYGRPYRERLRGQWGIVDVDDVVAAARGLVATGRADGERLAIEGGSAGGWTVLSALVSTDVFAAGISRYGVGDARALVAASPDFESRYLDGLIGPLPEAEELYRQRSPLGRADGFSAPMLLLQGAEDAVVPPAQSAAVADALAARGVPHAHIVYDGEGHGFRGTATVVDVLEKELAFLGRVLGFETPGVPPITLV